MNATSTKPTKKSTKYENNPFFIAINGIELLFQKANTVAIALVVLTVLSALSALPSYFGSPSSDRPVTDHEVNQFKETVTSVPVEAWLVVALVALIFVAAFIAVGIVISGVMNYASAQLARGKTVGLGEAFRAVFANFWGYTWVMIVVGVKTFLWTLLFIIPGIIMSVRYSLAGVAYFDKKLSGNGSVKESLRLTKDGWLTTFASQSLINFVTMGLIAPLLGPGTQAVLYRQFADLDAKNAKKPSAHVLSWLTLLVPLVLALLFVIGAALLLMTAVNHLG